MSVQPATTTFQDRDLELGAMLAGPSGDVHLINFYGEAGIGKSRLLTEGAISLRANPQALVLDVDLKALPQAREGRSLALLRQMAKREAQLQTVGDDPDVAAGQIVDQLSTIGGDRPVTLLVDTTEAVQDDPGFWQWFEKYVLSPLVSEGKVLVVLAGKLPAPIRLVEVRRYLKVWPLEPLPVEKEARNLVQEVLAASHNGSGLGDHQTTKRGTRPADELTDVVLTFSHGHPLLSQKLALYLADPANREPVDSLRRRVAEKVVGPFIDKELFGFGSEMARWRSLMEWASVLDWFDATVLYRFWVTMSGSRQPETDWQYDFVKAMAQLRAPYAVVKWEVAGYTLVGTVKSIVASYMQAARREEYMKALAAAAEVFNWIAEGYFGDNPEAAEPYRKAAQSYKQRLEWEVQYGTAQ